MGKKTGRRKKRRPWWIYVLRAVGVLLVLVAAVLIGARLYFRLPVKAYYKASEHGFVIPGCNDNFVAQGLAYDESSGCFWANGYQKDDKPSTIYIVAPGAKKPEKTIRMLLPDGTAYKGHAGGIAVGRDYVYVADGGSRRLLVFSYDSIYGAEDGAGVAAVGFFSNAVSDTDFVGPAFVTIDGDKLMVGEFYRDPNYQTPESHKITTLAGDYHQALGVVYQLDDGEQFGVSPEPVSAFTLPDLAQGMCIDNGKIYVSTSWGTSKSHIYQYDQSRLQLQGTIPLLGRELPLYSLDSAALLADREIAPMSEEIVVVDGKLYTMCESASNKYIFGKFTSAKWCYATKMDFFE